LLLFLEVDLERVDLGGVLVEVSPAVAVAVAIATALVAGMDGEGVLLAVVVAGESAISRVVETVIV